MLGVVVQIDGFDPLLAQAVTLRAASHDDPAVCHVGGGDPWWPALIKLPTLRYDLFDGAFGGEITAPSSSLTLAAEPWPNLGRYALADARLRLWTGDVGAAWATWTLRFDGRVSEQPELADNTATINFAVDDRWLDAALLTTYAGTTGAEGTEALKGQPKPLALGTPRYVAGTLINNIDTVFQLSAYGPLHGFEAALERLARFGAPVGDYASYAALVAANVPAGRWATAKAVGMVRLGAPPTGQVSFLIGGDEGGPNGWARLPGAIIRRLALLSGGAGRINQQSLDALDVARPYNQSIYVDQQTTARQLIQQIAASVNAVAGVSWTGQLFVVPVGIGAPGGLTLAADGSALPPVASVKQIGIASPFQKLAIGAARAWTVHALSDIAFTATLINLGTYDDGTTYREGNIVQSNGSSWLYTNATPSAGNTPPDLPVEQNAWWSVLAKAGADGRDGLDGTNGARGAAGADGKTSYIHYAYANSPDGAVDFDLNQPNGRAYEGSYTDFTAADSTDRNVYTWREYKGPPFGMAARGNAVVAGNSVIKNGGTDGWDSDAYSTVGFRNGAVLSFKGTGNQNIMVGLNTDPTTDSGYMSLDYAWYLRDDRFVQIFESGNPLGPPFLENYGDGRFSIDYNGKRVRYLYGDTEMRNIPVDPGKTFYFDSSIRTVGGRINEISFAARGADGTDGRDGLNGNNGTPGAPGADGRTSYLHTAYANAADGSADFTTGAPGTRRYLGVLVDFTVADSENPAAYTWSLIKGADGLNGTNGTPGAPGVDGRPTYVHIAYANAADGSVDFSVDNPAGRIYVGFYVDQSVADSTNPASYSWSLVKGADGKPGLSSPQPAPVVLALDYGGNVKGGQLPAVGQVSIFSGSADVTSLCALSVTSMDGCNGSIAANGSIRITSISAEKGGMAWSATYEGAIVRGTYAYSTARDGRPGTAQQVQPSSPPLGATFADTSAAVTLAVGPNGTVTATHSLSLGVSSNDRAVGTRILYRTTPGSGAWTIFASGEGTGAPGETADAYASAAISAQSAQTVWEFKVQGYRSGTGGALRNPLAVFGWAP